MHYKKRKLFVHYSIPIWFRKKLSKLNLCNKEKLHLVSYSIPLSCMVVFLLGLGMMINPDHSVDGRSYAVDGAARANVNPVLGLAVTNSDNVIETVQGGDTAYSDHLVTVTGTEVTNYTLSMSSSSSNLTKPSGASGVEITGAGGVTGDSMTANHWGYAVVEEGASDSSYGGLAYNTIPTTATEIAEGNAAADGTLNAKKKIVIAAKFGEDAAPGTYRQTINLNAVANPTTVTFKITYDSNGGGTAPVAVSQNSMENSVNFTLAGQGSMGKSGYKFVGWSTNQNAASGAVAGSSYTVYRTQPQITLYAVWKTVGIQGITEMQQMTPEVCMDTTTGTTATLKDNRGTSPISYKVIKMGDDTCWMAENLRLMNTTIDSTNSDMTSGSFTIPASSLSNFGSYSSMTDGYAPHAYYGYDTVYGAYYNWYTATAGAGTSSVTSGDVSTSICPKGWKLPAYSGTGSFLNLKNNYISSWTSVNSKSGYKMGYNSNDAFWPAAGYVNDSSVSAVGSAGFYWSRKAFDASYAHTLFLTDSYAYLQHLDYRYYGFSVRCVAAP